MNLETGGRPQDTLQLGLFHRDLALVHVLHQELHLLLVDVFEEDGWVFARVADEQVSEVGTAGRQDQLVSLELLRLGGEGHVGQQLLLG